MDSPVVTSFGWTTRGGSRPRWVPHCRVVLIALIVIKTFLVLSPMRARLRLNPFLVLRGTAEGDGLLRADESSKHPAQEAPPAPPSPRSS